MIMNTSSGLFWWRWNPWDSPTLYWNTLKKKNIWQAAEAVAGEIQRWVVGWFAEWKNYCCHWHTHFFMWQQFNILLNDSDFLVPPCRISLFHVVAGYLHQAMQYHCNVNRGTVLIRAFIRRADIWQALI